MFVYGIWDILAGVRPLGTCFLGQGSRRKDICGYYELRLGYVDYNDGVLALFIYLQRFFWDKIFIGLGPPQHWT